MEQSNTYQAVRIGDVADWRLVVHIASTGMAAWLRHLDPTHALVTLFDVSWPEDESQLLKRIEVTVYDHPQVLDDFSADVIVRTPDNIWVPTRLVADDEEMAAELYSKVFEESQEMPMTSTVNDATSLFLLVPGLHAFLQRTLPGARIHSHLSVLVERLRNRPADGPSVYVEIRRGEADFVAFDQKELLSGATQPWHDPADIEYHLFNLLHVYGLDPQTVQVSISGLREVKSALLPELRKHIPMVMLTMVPTIASGTALPLEAALMMRSNTATWK